MMFFAIKRFLLECSFYIFDLFYFYGNKSFRKADQALFLEYIFKNPYRVSKDFLKKNRAKEVYTYGETPLKTAFQLLKLCKLEKDDHFIDLGSGSGRLCLFVHFFSNATVSAVERNPVFCQKMEKIIKKLNLFKIYIVNKNYLDIDLQQASVVYLCDLFISESDIKKFIEQCSDCKQGTKVITVGFPINFTENIRLIYEWEGEFLWGVSTIYINEIF